MFGGGDAQKCCVLIDNLRTGLGPGDADVLAVRCPNGRPTPGASLQDAQALIAWEVPDEPLPEGESGYMGVFRQGAIVVPHVLALADPVIPVLPAGDRRRVTTRRSLHAPWKKIKPKTIDVPARWLVPLLRSEHLLPLAVAPEAPSTAILPLGEDGRFLGIEEARREPDWKAMDKDFHSYKALGRTTPTTLLAHLDYQGKASRQLPLAPADRDAPLTRVIYPTSSDIMRGCRTQARTQLIDATLYRSTFETPEEAAYLVALLNAPALNAAFVQSRRSGRDFHLHPWKRVPIPSFDPANALHQRLAALCADAEREAADFLEWERDDLPTGQVGRSKRIRAALAKSGLTERLDAAARELLPEQCR